MMEKNMRTSRIVVITGAAGGIGKPVVERFLDNGDMVVATDAKEDALAELKAGLPPSARLYTVAADISDEASCAKVADAARRHGDRVDVLVNVAGYFPVQPFEDTTAEDFRKVVDINLTGVFLMIKAVHPLMKGRGWGRIVNIGSASTFEGVADQAPYVAAKSGVFGLSRSLAKAFGTDGITVNVVTPGLTVTPPVKKNIPDTLLKQQVELRCIKRDEKPEDLVGTVFFLASPDADFISGQTINVDGGKHML
jgi:NAD(P)-dependent dehydrogenase (short-subunit alcohol dehydrogenase family)